MRLRIVVVGVPGVGKSTVVEKLLSELGNAKLATFGSVMLEEGLSLGWVKDRDEIRTLPVEKQRKLQELAASRISKMKEPRVVVDTHLFIRTKEGFWPGLPFDVVRALKPTHLVLIEAEPQEITRRRNSDKTRYRDAVTREALAEEMSLARSFITVSSTLTGAPVLILSNGDGESGKVARSLAKTLKGAAS